MKKINHHLGSFYKKTKESRVVDDKTIFYTFTKVAREEFGQRGVKIFTPQYFNKETLVVHVDKSTWAQELWFIRDNVIVKINHHLGYEAVQKISITNNKSAE